HLRQIADVLSPYLHTTTTTPAERTEPAVAQATAPAEPDTTSQPLSPPPGQTGPDTAPAVDDQTAQTALSQLQDLVRTLGSGSAVARELGFDPSTVNPWLRGRPMSADAAGRIAGLHGRLASGDVQRRETAASVRDILESLYVKERESHADDESALRAVADALSGGTVEVDRDDVYDWMSGRRAVDPAMRERIAEHAALVHPDGLPIAPADTPALHTLEIRYLVDRLGPETTAELLGVPPQVLESLQAGTSSPTLEVAERITATVDLLLTQNTTPTFDDVTNHVRQSRTWLQNAIADLTSHLKTPTDVASVLDCGQSAVRRYRQGGHESQVPKKTADRIRAALALLAEHRPVTADTVDERVTPDDTATKLQALRKVAGSERDLARELKVPMSTLRHQLKGAPVSREFAERVDALLVQCRRLGIDVLGTATAGADGNAPTTLVQARMRLVLNRQDPQEDEAGQERAAAKVLKTSQVLVRAYLTGTDTPPPGTVGQRLKAAADLLLERPDGPVTADEVTARVNEDRNRNSWQTKIQRLRDGLGSDENVAAVLRIDDAAVAQLRLGGIRNPFRETADRINVALRLLDEHGRAGVTADAVARGLTPYDARPKVRLLVQYLGTAEAARKLGVNESTVRLLRIFGETDQLTVDTARRIDTAYDSLVIRLRALGIDPAEAPVPLTGNELTDLLPTPVTASPTTPDAPMPTTPAAHQDHNSTPDTPAYPFTRDETDIPHFMEDYLREVLTEDFPGDVSMEDDFPGDVSMEDDFPGDVSMEEDAPTWEEALWASDSEPEDQRTARDTDPDVSPAVTYSNGANLTDPSAALSQLNDLVRILGSGAAVASELRFAPATVTRWLRGRPIGADAAGRIDELHGRLASDDVRSPETAVSVRDILESLYVEERESHADDESALRAVADALSGGTVEVDRDDVYAWLSGRRAVEPAMRERIAEHAALVHPDGLPTAPADTPALHTVEIEYLVDRLGPDITAVLLGVPPQVLESLQAGTSSPTLEVAERITATVDLLLTQNTTPTFDDVTNHVRQSRTWLQNAIADLTSHLKTPTAVAGVLDCSRKAVGKYRRGGHESQVPKKTADRIRAALALLAEHRPVTADTVNERVTPDDTATKLKALRKVAGSERDLARELKVSPATLRRQLNGAPVFREFAERVDALFEQCRRLGIDVLGTATAGADGNAPTTLVQARMRLLLNRQDPQEDEAGQERAAAEVLAETDQNRVRDYLTGTATPPAGTVGQRLKAAADLLLERPDGPVTAEEVTARVNEDRNRNSWQTKIQRLRDGLGSDENVAAVLPITRQAVIQLRLGEVTNPLRETADRIDVALALLDEHGRDVVTADAVTRRVTPYDARPKVRLLVQYLGTAEAARKLGVNESAVRLLRIFRETDQLTVGTARRIDTAYDSLVIRLRALGIDPAEAPVQLTGNELTDLLPTPATASPTTPDAPTPTTPAAHQDHNSTPDTPAYPFTRDETDIPTPHFMEDYLREVLTEDFPGDVSMEDDFPDVSMEEDAPTREEARWASGSEPEDQDHAGPTRLPADDLDIPATLLGVDSAMEVDSEPEDMETDFVPAVDYTTVHSGDSGLPASRAGERADEAGGELLASGEVSTDRWIP
ncbi:hypothetical protein PV408_45520, partial [Streptomyces sp. ME18-1-4]|nr:hypothetical protein [Streptomyces sp. ME18-1-4]